MLNRSRMESRCTRSRMLYLSNFLVSKGRGEPGDEGHRDCFLTRERYRGLDDHEDHLNAAAFGIQLSLEESVTLVFTSEPNVDLHGESTQEAQRSHDSQITSARGK